MEKPINYNEIKSYIERSHGALKWAKKGLVENDYWVAISYSYYAAFYIAKAFLLSRQIITKTHKGTRSEFGKIYDKEKIISFVLNKWFSKAMQERIMADYEVSASWTKDEAKQSVYQAEKFVLQLQKLIKMPK